MSPVESFTNDGASDGGANGANFADNNVEIFAMKYSLGEVNFPVAIEIHKLSTSPGGIND